MSAYGCENLGLHWSNSFCNILCQSFSGTRPLQLWRTLGKSVFGPLQVVRLFCRWAQCVSSEALKLLVNCLSPQGSLRDRRMNAERGGGK